MVLAVLRPYKAARPRSHILIGLPGTFAFTSLTCGIGLPWPGPHSIGPWRFDILDRSGLQPAADESANKQV